MNKPLRRVISAALALSLSVTLAVNAYAEEIEKVHKHEAVSTEAVATKEKSEKAKKPEKTPITKDNLPEVLDFDRVKGQGFVSRLNSEEQDMCEIILENEDGTRGLYIFDSPVKFKNKNGETVDKSNKVKPHTKNGAPCFKSESNDIEVHLPATIQGGVSLKDEEVNVSMKPIPSVASKRALSVGKQKDEDSVIYEDVFDNFTDIVYTFTYDGVKEDIVLEKYNGKNTFDFEVITGGLSLEEEKGALLLKDENGEVKATMGEIVIFSADNKNNTFGEYKITEKQKNNSYILTLCVDAAYLTSPDTKYPVTIDPTISSAHNKCGMQDMQVFKGVDGTGKTETSAGRSGVSRVGWTDWGVCRTLVNFKSDLLTSNNIKYSNQIIEASIEIRDLMCQSQSTTIYCYQFNGLSSWSDTDTKTWNQLQADKLGITADQKTVSATSGSLPSKSLGNPSTDTWNLWHKFNLTNVVKNWAGSSSLISKGLIFKAESAKETATKAAYMKTFSSMEGNENYKPYFFIRYNSYTPVTNVRFSISSLTLEEKETYTFHPIVTPSTATNQEFTWTSSNKNVATVSSSGKVTAKAAGTTVITVKSKANTNATATCKVTVKENPLSVKEIRFTPLISDTEESTICIIKLYNGDFIWQQWNNSDPDTTQEYYITGDVIKQLNEYNETADFKPETYYPWEYLNDKNNEIAQKIALRDLKRLVAIQKKSLDEEFLVEFPNIAKNSEEYYGMWIKYVEAKQRYDEAGWLVRDTGYLITDVISLGFAAFDLIKTVKQYVTIRNTVKIVGGKQAFISIKSIFDTPEDVKRWINSGAKSPKGLIGEKFEAYLVDVLGGEGSFKLEGREFDGKKGNRWWEAKSGNYWSDMEKNEKMLENFRSTMGHQLKIAKDNGATIELFSNTPIPDWIKTWLAGKGIKYTELLF